MHDESHEDAISFTTLSAGEVRRSFGHDELEQLTELTQLFDRLPAAGGAFAGSPFSGGFGFRKFWRKARHELQAAHRTMNPRNAYSSQQAEETILDSRG